MPAMLTISAVSASPIFGRPDAGFLRLDLGSEQIEQRKVVLEQALILGSGQPRIKQPSAFHVA